MIKAQRGAAGQQESGAAVGVAGFVEKGQARVSGNGLFGRANRGVADEIEGGADDIVVGFGEDFGAGHGFGEESFVEETEFVAANGAAQDKHEFEDIAAAHQMYVFVNPRGDALAFVEWAIGIRAPDVVSLNVVNAFGEIHPVVLGGDLELFLMQLTNQARAGRELRGEPLHHVGELLTGDETGFQGHEQSQLACNDLRNKDGVDDGECPVLYMW